MQLVLTENRYLRIGTFTTFYVAQGLPIGLISIALPAWLGAAGASATDIANFLAISGLPWGFKLFAGPIMDRFAYLPMGRRRPWVIAAQGGLLFSLIAMAFTPNPLENIILLTLMAFAVNLFAAVQDVAVDGMAIDVLPVDERGKANAFMAFGQVVGYSGSGALSAMALNYAGLAGACLMLATGVGLIFLWAIIVRERVSERVLPWTEGEASARSMQLQAENWGEIFMNLLRVSFLPASVILMTMTLCWRISDGFWISAAPVIMTQELGYDSEVYPYWTSVTGFIFASLGLLLGPLIDRSGAKQFLIIASFGMAGTYFAAGFFSDSWTSPSILLAILCGNQLFGQIMFISFIAIHMNVCWERVAATQFAIYMAWSNLTRSVGAGFYGQINESIASSQVPLIMGSVCFIAGILMLFVNMQKHENKLKSLDAVEA